MAELDHSGLQVDDGPTSFDVPTTTHVCRKVAVPLRCRLVYVQADEDLRIAYDNVADEDTLDETNSEFWPANGENASGGGGAPHAIAPSGVSPGGEGRASTQAPYIAIATISSNADTVTVTYRS